MAQNPALTENMIILGNGFIGSNLHRNLNIPSLHLPIFDITNPKTYKNYNFYNRKIIDCIAKIDGNSEKKYEVNVNGLKKFIDYLNQEYYNNYEYIYFSSLSTEIKNVREVNEYVQQKYEAEKYIKTNARSYKIIRLSYPFGEHQDKVRLIPRLIYKIINDEEIQINDEQIFITPINTLINHFYKLLKNPLTEINFISDKPISLEQLVIWLAASLGKKPNYSISKNNLNCDYNKLFPKQYRFGDFNEQQEINQYASHYK